MENYPVLSSETVAKSGKFGATTSAASLWSGLWVNISPRVLIAGVAMGCLVGCSSGSSTPAPEPTKSAGVPSAAPTAKPTNPNSTKSNSPDSDKPANPKAADAVRFGNVKELEGDVTCRQTGGIYAYGETTNFKVYICSDANNPDQPRYYRSFNRDGSPGLNLTAEKYDPLKGSMVEFRNDDYTYGMDLLADGGDKPMLRVGLPGGKTNTEPLTVLLNRASTKGATGKGSSNRANSQGASQPTSSAAIRHVLDHEAELGICDPDAPKEKRQASTYTLGDGKILVKVICFTAAYQVAYGLAVYTEPEGKPSATALSFDSFDVEKDPKQPTKTKIKGLVGLLNFDNDSKQLTVTTKYRGVGDCGQRAVYKWDGDKFALKVFQAKVACDGKYQKPTEYPQIFP